MDSSSLIRRSLTAAGRALLPAYKSIRFLILLMVPVSLAMLMLDYFGVLSIIATGLNPLMQLVGLPGEAALVFLSSLALNLYSVIAVIASISLSMRELCIIASMCLIAHSLLIECSIMHKTGSSALKMAVLRLSAAIITGLLLNLLLPADFMRSTSPVAVIEAAGITPAFMTLFVNWAADSAILMFRIAAIVTSLMILHEILEEFGILMFLGRLSEPLMTVLGLPSNAGFLWIIANTVGLSFGSAILIKQTESGKISRSDSDLFNHHIGISHSLLEDTLLFVAIGVPFFWAVVPRLAMALLIVWLEKIRRGITKAPFRIGIV